jgi:hypothetical protein
MWNSQCRCFVFDRSHLSGGSKKTVEFARMHNKPCRRLHSGERDATGRYWYGGGPY